MIHAVSIACLEEVDVVLTVELAEGRDSCRIISTNVYNFHVIG